MPSYKAPIEDMAFLLGEVFPFDAVMAGLPGQEEMTAEFAVGILEEAGRFTSEVIQPLSRPGDEAGTKLENGQVYTAPGYVAAYKQFAEAGWPSLSGDPEFGGQGLPRTVQILADEMLSSADVAFGLFPGLTRGASEAIHAHATDELKAKYLPKMTSGEWTGAMALTEAHSGTDLGLLRTRAEPVGDGSYKLYGTKIFITAGDQDLTDNIIHLVLARLPDAEPGVKGISLFLSPKFLVNEDGSLGERNAFSAGAIEHKMGIKSSPTCVMNYDGAIGWLVGKPGKGLACMFTMMNAERLFVGVEGLAVGEAAYQGGVAYAKDRLQGRSPYGGKGPAPIIVHPDVRRMLLTTRALTEAGRALAVWTAIEMDKAKLSPDADARAEADDMVALVTPVIKAALTDFGLESAIACQQVFGGHGYIREWGMEQLVRDARITQIYEGTNGVQSMDLVGRKLTMEGGRLPARFFALVDAELEALAGNAATAAYVTAAKAGIAALKRATDSLTEQDKTDPGARGAAAVAYLHLFAIASYGWLWAKMATAAVSASEKKPIHDAKVKMADYFFAHVAPRALTLEAQVAAGAATMMALDAEAF